jgi:hypothetical protein
VQIRRENRVLLLAACLLPELVACDQADINLGLRGDARVPTDIEPTPSDDEVVDAARDSSVDGSTSGRKRDAAVDVPDAGTSTGPGDAKVDGAGGGSAPQQSEGCGRPAPATDTSIRVDGMTGPFVVELPADYDETRAYPLLLTFRGANTTAALFREYLRLPQEVGTTAIVVHLDCLNGASTWDLSRDLPFFDALLSHLGSSYCVDEQRQFALGHAAGAALVNTLGCLRGDKLRAIAPLSVGPTAASGPVADGTCVGQPAVWLIQGSKDTATGVARFNRDQWLRRNQCATRSTAVEPSPCVEYAGCDVVSPLRYCEYDGGVELPDFASSGAWSFFRSL